MGPDPCNPAAALVSWVFSKCDFDDFNGWADAADQKLAAAGVNLTQFKHRWARGRRPQHPALFSPVCLRRKAPAMPSSDRACCLLCRVYLIPPSACGFVGLAYIGCDGSFECRAWISSDLWTTPQVRGAVLAAGGVPHARPACPCCRVCVRRGLIVMTAADSRCGHTCLFAPSLIQAYVHELGHHTFLAHASTTRKDGSVDE